MTKQEIEQAARKFATAPLGLSGRDFVDEKELLAFMAGARFVLKRAERMALALSRLEDEVEASKINGHKPNIKTQKMAQKLLLQWFGED